jgi:hypothetical protein
VERIREFLGGVERPEQVFVTTNNPALTEGEWGNIIEL